MAIVPLFKHRKKHIRVTGHSLKCYTFTNHRYFTIDEAQIAELKKLVATKACGIYIDPNEAEIDTEASDPISQLQKSMREQILQELRAGGKLLEDSTSDTSSNMKAAVNTASSVVTPNAAAEANEDKRLEALADKQTAAIVASNPALAALEAMKAKSSGTPQ